MSRSRRRPLLQLIPCFALAVCLASTVQLADAPSAPAFGFINQWGGPGHGKRNFGVNGGLSVVGPNAVAVAPSGVVYVSVAGENQIKSFTPSGALLALWPAVSGDLAVDGTGTVYVSDFYDNTVEKLSLSGTTLARWGGRGATPGRFSYPQGIAVDSGGSVYVADRGNHRIQKFNASGAFVGEWGGRGTGPGEFGGDPNSGPSGVAVGPAGDVYVTDPANRRVQRFTPSGALVGLWGGLGSPDGIATDSVGNVYVSDTASNLIDEFTASGAFVGRWGRRGEGAGTFSNPAGLAVDPAGNVYVADFGNKLLQVFGPSGPVDYCVVPRLQRKKLRRARRLLVRANCRLGHVGGPRAGMVARQRPRARTLLPVGGKVAVRLRCRLPRSGRGPAPKSC